MKYLLMIYSNEADNAKRSEEESAQYIADFRSFTEDIMAAGQMIAGDALTPVATATTVRIRDGKRVVTDGPFAETREQLGGYYLVEAKDLDEAIDIAGRIPTAKHGSIEVRPIFVWD